jgi:hypothetical protein
LQEGLNVSAGVIGAAAAAGYEQALMTFMALSRKGLA